jgi:hypothetical protein
MLLLLRLVAAIKDKGRFLTLPHPPRITIPQENRRLHMLRGQVRPPVTSRRYTPAQLLPAYPRFVIAQIQGTNPNLRTPLLRNHPCSRNKTKQKRGYCGINFGQHDYGVVTIDKRRKDVLAKAGRQESNAAQPAGDGRRLHALPSSVRKKPVEPPLPPSAVGRRVRRAIKPG